ncbi:hypothetical protein [Bradyrhizobium sp. RDM12]
MSGQQESWAGELPVLRATEWALRSELALPPQAAPQEPLTAAWLQQAGQPDAPVLPQAAAGSVSVRAAGLLPEEVSVRAAAGLPPEEVSAPWVQQAAAGAADESRAAQPGRRRRRA